MRGGLDVAQLVNGVKMGLAGSPVLLASSLSAFSSLPAWAITLLVLALVLVLSLFSVVGMMLRNDPEETPQQALLFGMASSLLALAMAMASGSTNPWVLLVIVMGAALAGPIMLRREMNRRRDKDSDDY